MEIKCIYWVADILLRFYYTIFFLFLFKLIQTAERSSYVACDSVSNEYSIDTFILVRAIILRTTPAISVNMTSGKTAKMIVTINQLLR